MLKALSSFLTRFTQNGSHADAEHTVRIIPRDQHPISRNQFSRGALDVLYGLHKAGYEAFLVGGCLRDILSGETPKDFDVVTNATPEEVHALFRRSRLIGRRFRIVHVRSRGEIIEVSTFRAHNQLEDDADTDHRKCDQSGMILRDNVFGTIEEDALRRDFTANALYYNIANFNLYDFANSLPDIKTRTLRLIGEPARRYEEDPVRMLRAARFAAKLGYTIEPATAQAIHHHAAQLLHVPPARLFDEVLKLFLSGYAQAALVQLQQYPLFATLFPQTHALLPARPWAQTLIELAARNTDQRLAADKPVTPAFLFAVILWPAVVQEMQKAIDKGMPAAPALSKAAGRVMNRQVSITSIPRRFSTVVRDIWEMQLRLPKRHGKRAEALVQHPKFRAAYDFLLLREEAGEIPAELGEWWTRYQQADSTERAQMTSSLGQGTKPRRRKRRKKPSGPAE